MKKLWYIRLLTVCMSLTFCGCAGTEADMSNGTDGRSADPVESHLPSSVVPSAETPFAESPSSPDHAADSRIQNLPRYDAGYAPRFYDEPVNDFIPSEEYGTIYPYIGKINKDQNDGEWAGKVYGYGFVDAQGRIVCDPVYTEVRRITYGDRFVYAVTARYYEEEGKYYDEDESSLIQGFEAVIGADGSFYQKYDDIYIASEIITFEYEYVAVMKNDRWGAIGFDGTMVLPFAYGNAPLFSEGLAAVYLTEGEYGAAAEAYDTGYRTNMLEKYYQLKTPYIYVNEKGETVLGPYQCPPRSQLSSHIEGEPFEAHLEAVAFRNGMAMNFADMYYGFINKSGELKIPRQYVLMKEDQFWWNQYGYALVCLADVEENTEYQYYQFSYNGVPDEVVFALIDTSGNKLCEYTSHPLGIYRYDDNYYVLDNRDYEFSQVFDMQGNDILMEGDTFLGNGWFSERTTENTNGEMYLRGHGIERTLWGYYIQHLAGDWFVVEDDNWEMIRVVNGRTNEDMILSEGINRIYVRESAGERSVVRVSFNSGRNEEAFGMINHVTGEVLIDFTYDQLTRIGEYYLAATGYYGGLLDQDGKWIIKTPLFGNYD